MTKEECKIGHVVQLQSGRQKYTVTKLPNEKEIVQICHEEQGKMIFNDVHVEALKLVSKEDEDEWNMPESSPGKVTPTPSMSDPNWRGHSQTLRD